MKTYKEFLNEGVDKKLSSQIKKIARLTDDNAGLRCDYEKA